MAINLNLFQENTLQQILDETKKTTTETERIARAQQARTDMMYRAKVAAANSVSQVNSLFVTWWKSQEIPGITTREELLSRWFGTVLDDKRVHGSKTPLFKTSQAPKGEFLNDSIGMVCTPSTASSAERDDFAYLPQFWALEVSAEKLPDGSHKIHAVEFIDSTKDVRCGEYLTWVLQKNTYQYVRTYGQYRYRYTRCHPEFGYTRWKQGTDKNGKTYAYIANPKYGGCIGPDGRITCGTGLKPALFLSHDSGVKLWRERGQQYAGASGALLEWQSAMFELKYAVKGNSGVIEGCTYYWGQYKAAVSEKGVQRIILSPSEADNLLVGSTVSIGNLVPGQEDRYYPCTRDLAELVPITAIEEVTIGDVLYKAVTVDNGGTPFDTVAGTSAISTMPYRSGYNDTVLGYDGSRTNPTGGKEPGLIQRTEFQIGAYLILADELWKWSQSEPGGDYTLDVYVCKDQSKVANSITPDYEIQEELRLTFPSSTKNGWLYIEDAAISKEGVCWPAKVSAEAGSGTGCKAGFYVAPSSDAIRAAWCCCLMTYGSDAGLRARYTYNGTTNSDWLSAPGAPGLNG